MDRFLRHILKGVSRSIYLSIRILPRRLRDPVGIAYLFCRTADTIADTDLIEAGKRLDRLREFRACFQADRQPNSFGTWLTSGEDDPDLEAELLRSLDKVFQIYRTFSPPVRQIIAELVGELTLGMEMDLNYFGEATAETIRPLPDRVALDRYTYYVAGVVGRFWTSLLYETTPACHGKDRKQMTEWGIHYGQGLQMINILRDLPRDLQRGRCYLPADELATIGLRPRDLTRPEVWPLFQPLYARWLGDARKLLAEGRRYVAALPHRWIRTRLATALPLRLGLATLTLLENDPRILDPTVVIKIPRRKVYFHLLIPGG